MTVAMEIEISAPSPRTRPPARKARRQNSVRARAKVFFYTGENPRNKSGVSWKVWQIARQEREVTAWWGSAGLEKRRPVPKGKLRTKTWRFATQRAAEVFERTRIQQKLNNGYYPVRCDD